jgi:tetratricopeptide (TPR) repeat protein
LGSAEQGDFQKGIAEIQEGLKIERATGALLYESYILGLLADACLKNERYGQALEVLNQARLRHDEKNSEHFYAAEIYRLLGEAYLRSDKDLDQAEHFFCRGLKVAREQKAKSLELKLCGPDVHEQVFASSVLAVQALNRILHAASSPLAPPNCSSSMLPNLGSGSSTRTVYISLLTWWYMPGRV